MKTFERIVRGLGIAVAVALAGGCGKTAGENEDSQTHWLDPCSSAADCGALDCVCGHCVKICADDTGCADRRDASCVGRGTEAWAELCGGEPDAPNVCLDRCDGADCGEGQRCVDGHCVAEPTGGSGAAGSAGAGGEAGAGQGGAGSLEPPGPRVTEARKVDLLFMIDNSISMADKQEVLAVAVPDLVSRLVNPVCIDPATGLPSGATPSSPTEACGGSTVREFAPIDDIHIGVISSSIGGPPIDVCNTGEQDTDNGKLVGLRPRAVDLGLSEGFLAWSPGTELPAFNNVFTILVTRVGEFGCGFESSLEAWYRFLIDPMPPQQVEVGPCGAGNNNPCATPVGIDEDILQQRAAFLRPDSMVAIVMVTDENDCSTQNTGQLYYSARQDVTLPRSSSMCASNPNDACCYSCGLGVPDGCAQDPICQTPLADADDPLNLRCFDQKRRFGIDFLYPTDRYVNALKQPGICTSRTDLSMTDCPDSDGDGAADLVPNPLYRDLSGGGAAVRDESLVFLAGIVGVPWQDIETPVDVNGNPVPPQDLRFQNAVQMIANSTWSVILGDPSSSPPVPPAEPLMIESIDPRGGTTVGTGEALVGPANVGRLANSVNGHEWANRARDDLQYACIFPLAEPRDCTALLDRNAGCDCLESDPFEAAADANPLCQATDGSYGTTQYFAKAYPGLRQLQVLRDYGDNSVVASICARNVTNRSAADFGYRPAITALVDRFREAAVGSARP